MDGSHARRRGFLYLRPGAGARDEGDSSAVRDRGQRGEPRLLRQHPVFHVPDRLGDGLPVGSAGGPLRTRALAHAGGPLLFAVHVSRVRGSQYLGAWYLPPAGWIRCGRRVRGRRHVHRRGTARRTPRAGRGRIQQRLLRGNVCGGRVELRDRRALWLARHVRDGRFAGAPDRMDPVQCQRTGALARAQEANRRVESTRLVFRLVLQTIPTDHGFELRAVDGFDDRPVGGIGLCAGSSDPGCFARWIFGRGRRAHCLVGDHAACHRDHHRLPVHAFACGPDRQARCARFLFRAHDDLDLIRLRLRVLPATPRAAGISSLSVFRGVGGRQLQRVLGLDA